MAALILIGIPVLVLLILSFFVEVPYNTPSEGYEISELKYKTIWGRKE